MSGLRVASCLLPLLAFSHAAEAELGVNFPPPVSTLGKEIYHVHTVTMTIATVLLVLVFSFVIYSLVRHRKSRNFPADQHFHETWFGRWSWVLVPLLVLGVDLTIANSAESTLESVWTVPKDQKMLDVKIIGHQWWWEYQYLDHDIKVESRPLDAEKAGEHYLREVDNRLVLPTGTKVRFLHTSADVNHAFWVPEIGFKRDAIPGYVTESWVELTEEGVFRGQCAELCGTWHARMPAVVEAVSPERFAVWVEEQKAVKLAAAAEASIDKTWTMEEMMAKGQELYTAKCSACHQPTGLGMPPTFPPLKGSAVATGPLADHLHVVLNGRQGKAMPAFANTLNDLEIAAIVTYERNAWGNDTGDVVQPPQVKAAR